MPSFKQFYNEQKMSFKASFNSYLTQNGVDSEKIWEQVKHIIREVFELTNEKMRASLLNYKHKRFVFNLNLTFKLKAIKNFYKN